MRYANRTIYEAISVLLRPFPVTSIRIIRENLFIAKHL